jgi:hypothetical protein
MILLINPDSFWIRIHNPRSHSCEVTCIDYWVVVFKSSVSSKNSLLMVSPRIMTFRSDLKGFSREKVGAMLLVLDLVITSLFWLQVRTDKRARA